MTPYLFTTQTKIIKACFFIHSFIWQISFANRLFSKYDNEVELESDDANQNQNLTTNGFFCSIWSIVHATVLRSNCKRIISSI